MADPLIHIARNEELLGKFSEAEVYALVEAEFLKATDDYWIKGMKDWEPLSKLEPAEKKPPLLQRARDSASSARNRLAASAQKLTGQAKSLANKGSAGISQSKLKLLEDYLPQLKKLISEKTSVPVLNAARAAINNEALMTKTFGAAYDCLPKPVCRFVMEKDFVEFCLKHRKRLLADS